MQLKKIPNTMATHTTFPFSSFFTTASTTTTTTTTTPSAAGTGGGREDDDDGKDDILIGDDLFSLEEEEDNNNFSKGQKEDDDDDGDTLLMSKINAMSLEDRTLGLHDLHGVAEIQTETSELIRTKLLEMDHYLSNWNRLFLSNTTMRMMMGNYVPDVQKYYIALSMSTEYVHTMKIQCLRTDLYRTKHATIRLLRFFDHKSQLFGDESLVKEITFEDLDEETSSAVTNGFCQLLPQRDRTGRAIFLIYAKINLHYSTEALVRIEQTSMHSREPIMANSKGAKRSFLRCYGLFVAHLKRNRTHFLNPFIWLTFVLHVSHLLSSRHTVLRIASGIILHSYDWSTGGGSRNVPNERVRADILRRRSQNYPWTVGTNYEIQNGTSNPLRRDTCVGRESRMAKCRLHGHCQSRRKSIVSSNTILFWYVKPSSLVAERCVITLLSSFVT